MTELATEFDTLSYEEALSRLEDIVTHLERGDLPLEASMRRFEDGIALSRVCASRLAAAEGRIQKLVEGEGGALRLEPLAPQ
ncbi:MAG: exodeoxyribonuclease VII small subunit [Armatimonadetes bacterium]|nr:exodeoxyribonuclease VII small subunit [Armatimonadota bacterium]